MSPDTIRTRVSSEGRLDLPLDGVEIALTVMAADSVEEIVQHRYSHATSSLTHRRHHPPLVVVWVKLLHAVDGVARAPASNCQHRGEA